MKLFKRKLRNMWAMIWTCIRKWLEAISGFFAQVPGMGYFFIYLISIPIFAWIYSSYPYEFYHTTAKYEKGIDTEANQIMMSLRSLIVKEIYDHYKNNIITTNNWQLDSEAILAHSLSIRGEDVLLDLYLSIYLKVEGKWYGLFLLPCNVIPEFCSM